MNGLYKKIICASLFFFAHAYSAAPAPKKISYLKSASVTPYYFDQNGKTWFLLGKESRSTGVYWYSLGGKKDIGDRGSLQTALREGFEESAYTLEWSDETAALQPFYMSAGQRGQKFFIQTTKPSEPYSVAYFLRAKEQVKPTVMEEAKKKLTPEKKKKVEKIEWQWVNAQDFLSWVQKSEADDLHYPPLGVDARLYPVYKQTLNFKAVQDHIQEIIDIGKKRAMGKKMVPPAKKPTPSSAPAPKKEESKAPAKSSSTYLIPYSWSPKEGNTWVLLPYRGQSIGWSAFSFEGTTTDHATAIKKLKTALTASTGEKIKRFSKNPLRTQVGKNDVHLLRVNYHRSPDATGVPGEVVEWKWVKVEDLLKKGVQFQESNGVKMGLEEHAQAIFADPTVQGFLLKIMAKGKAGAKKRAAK